MSIILFFLGCSSQSVTLLEADQLPQVATEIQQKDVILVLIRGLRADLNTEFQPTTAFIDAIDTVPSHHYLSAYTQSTSDFVSTSSILTSMYPSAVPMCGIIRAGSDQISLDDQPWCSRIPEDRYTLATVLSIYGYRTHLLSLDTHWHTLVTAGFQTDQALKKKSLEDMIANAQSWWAAAADRPRFLMLILDDRLMQHQVYDNKAEARAHYLEKTKSLGSELRSLFSLTSDRPQSIYMTSLNGINLMEIDGFNDEPVPDGESDVLTERTLHVPLMIFDGSDPSTEDTVVENSDIFPSIIDSIGGKSPANIQGQPLRKAETNPFSYSEFGDMFALRRGEHLLVFRGFLHDHTSLDPDLSTRLSNYQPDFFTLSNVKNDPYQANNLQSSNQKIFENLYTEMKSIRADVAAPPVNQFTPKQLWDLRMTPAQGYW